MKDIGKYKVDALKLSISEKNPYVKITTSKERMVTVEDVENEIYKSDFVVCSMDEPPYIAQRLVNKACYKKKINSLYCFSQKSAGKLFFVSPDKTGCVDCLLHKHDSEEFQFLVENILSNSTNLSTANIKPNITLLCSWISKKWLDFFIDSNGGNIISGNIIYRFDFNNFKEEEFISFEKTNFCITCGKNNRNKSKLWEILKIE